MSIDFQQVREQVKQLGESAPGRARQFADLLEKVRTTLADSADSQQVLKDQVDAAAGLNPNLRSAVPGDEPLNTGIACPPVPDRATILAADGSQIYPDRHGSIYYSLVNVGAIRMTHGSGETPALRVRSDLLYDDRLYTEHGRITERLVALMRDLAEREMLAELARGLAPPILTLTDGPLELWNVRDGFENQRAFDEHFEHYIEALEKLRAMGASTAGYIDKPGSDLLVRLLEIAVLPAHDLKKAGRDHRPYRGITDVDLLASTLQTYERSAIFGIRSSNSARYADELALHFFYLNVGKTTSGRAYLARVEIPAWVAHDREMVDQLHAVLIDQCKTLGSRPYPYLLHRSHEVALVTQDEKAQVESMIALELRRQQLPVPDPSNKSHHKAGSGRTRRS